MQVILGTPNVCVNGKKGWQNQPLPKTLKIQGVSIIESLCSTHVGVFPPEFDAISSIKFQLAKSNKY